MFGLAVDEVGRSASESTESTGTRSFNPLRGGEREIEKTFA